MKDEVTVVAYSNLPEVHVMSALFNVEAAAVIEPVLVDEMKVLDGLASSSKLKAHRAHVMGAVIFSAAFVEAYINDVFGGYKPWANAEKIAQLQSQWADSNFRMKVGPFDKYKKAARIFDQTVDRSSVLSQEVLAVFDLRNYYVHGKPDEISVSSDQPELVMRPPTEDKNALKELEQRIFNRDTLRHAVHPIFNGPMNSWLNEKGVTTCLAKWALDSSINFVEDFNTKIGSSTRYIRSN